MSWRVNGWAWAMGFVAGAVLASYVALSCAPTRAQSPEVQAAIHQASVRHGVSEAWLRRVAYCESRFLPWARNTRSGAAGLFQFMPRTWAWMSGQAGWGGASPYDPYAAADVAAWAFRAGLSSHWSCR
jgi:soluble lytic murein transglycosylase-like protein